MLNFIVLGVVPGTRIQITFGWILLALSLVVVTTLVYIELNRIRPNRLHKQKLSNIERIAI